MITRHFNFSPQDLNERHSGLVFGVLMGRGRTLAVGEGARIVHGTPACGPIKWWGVPAADPNCKMGSSGLSSEASAAECFLLLCLPKST